MKFNKIRILSVFFVLICLMGTVSANEDVNDNISSGSSYEIDTYMDEVSVEYGDVQEIGYSSIDITIPNCNGYNDEVLSNDEIIYYVNNSADGDDGSSWENAFGGEWAIDDALCELADNGDREGIIYVADGKYSGIQAKVEHALKYNVTFIGQGINTILFDISSPIYGNGADLTKYLKYINFTINGGDLGRNTIFINCIFDGSISISKDLLNYDSRHVEEYGYAQTYFINFENCVFKDVTTADALVTLYKYGAVNFNNCTFENITADSLVYHNDISYFDEDGISFKNCTFTNCKYNGVADSLANFNDAIVIEDCNYDGEVSVGTTEVDGHFYVNATKLKVVAVATQMNISSTQRGVVVIAIRDANGNAVSGVTVNYVINGENMTGITDENGTITISDLTNEVVVSAVFAGNGNFLASNNTADFNFTIPKVATQLSCAGVTTYYNVGKNLVVTLKDANGNVLANKMVTVNFIGKTYTKVTDANGQIIFKLSATLLPKTYLTTITFAGDETLINSSVATKVVVKKATVKMAASAKTFKKSLKTKKYSITLKNNLGKVMKNTKVTLKIKGKTFSAYTNSKGVATQGRL